MTSRTDPRHRGTIHAPRTLLAALVLMGGLLALPAMDDTSMVEPARAQVGLDDCGLIGSLPACSFEIELTSWNETGAPGSILSGTLTITNNGDGFDAYAVAIEADEGEWEVEVDPSETDTVETDDSVEVAIRVVVPDTAALDDTTTVKVNVTSQNDDSVGEDLTFDARTGQVYEWAVTCDDEVTIQKGQEGKVLISVQNLGNGDDQATLTTRPLPEGIEIDEAGSFELEAGETVGHNATIAVGISLEEGEYTIDWDLQSQQAPEVSEQCSTTLSAVVGEGNGAGDGDEEDSPLPVALVLIVALTAALVGHRRRESA